jgi:hypothetical protein
MIGNLGRVLVLVLIVWSWVPVLTTSIYYARPIVSILDGDAIITIDRAGSDDSRITSASTGAFRVGDRFDASSIPFARRLLLYGYGYARQSDRVVVGVLRAGRRRGIVLRPEPYNVFTGFAPISVALWTLTAFLSALTMTATGALVLARPGILTRSLFLAFFGLLVGAVDPRPLPDPSAGWAVFLVLTCGYGFQAYCSWNGVRAATLFPDRLPGTHARTLLWMSGVLAVATGWWAMFRNSAGVLYSIGSTPDWLVSDSPTSAARALYFAAVIALNLLTALALALRYRGSPAEDRLKVRAVLAALAANAVVTTFVQIEQLVVPFHRGTTMLDEAVAWSGLVVYLLPVTIIAAIVRHRLFGIRFVLDRALVYGGLAVLLVAPLRLVNLLLAARFPHTRVATVAEFIVALGLAVTLEPLRRVVERIVRAVLFRKHGRALADLAQLGVTARAAPTTEHLAALVTTAGERLDLAGAALVFETDDTPHHVVDLPLDPALDIALRFGRRDLGRVLFGAHRNGGDLDPAEDLALRKFAAEIERAIDILVADRLQAQLGELKALLAGTVNDRV